MKNSPAASGHDTADAHAAWCRCGASRAESVHRLCTGAAALQHSARVEVRAELLLSRLRAIQLMGTMNGELRAL
ncbi:hypothetical protein BJ986_000240 [Phycicoccus badiiscoriae]|uniref:Uncharacterized protein n=1 Tax=Pedococcus badiiscoriae TaxID=642776 RepID=A0A852W9P4_9MICO|nr:hypothetical protein [Pedococcus badiiscoriae]NYG05753.1 hypothetical protein [Pedococcus badiiscoriae]